MGGLTFLWVTVLKVCIMTHMGMGTNHWSAECWDRKTGEYLGVELFEERPWGLDI